MALLRAVTQRPWLCISCGSTVFNVWLPNWQSKVTDVIFLSHRALRTTGVNASDLEGADVTSTNRLGNVA